MSTPDRLRLASVASCEIEWIVTVAEPISAPSWEAVTVAVSGSSSNTSTSAANVAVAPEAPAGRISVGGTPEKSDAAAVPERAKAMVWSSTKVAPLAMATVSVALSPSRIVAGSADTVNVAASSSSTVTEARDAVPAT